MKERSSRVTDKVNRWFICQIIYLETDIPGVFISFPVGNAVPPKQLKRRDLREGVTSRVMSEDPEAPRHWRLVKAVTLLGRREGEG